MEFLVALLFVLGIITLIGHGIWVLLAAIFRALSGSPTNKTAPLQLREQPYTPPRQARFCDHCGATLTANSTVCRSCGRAQREVAEKNAASDLDVTERQLQRFYEQGVLDELKFNWLKQVIANERQRLQQPVLATPEVKPPITPDAAPETVPEIAPERIVPIRVLSPEPAPASQIAAPSPFTQPPAPRQSFAEMLAAFMEEKNIRWGELLGGLLIIGCSLALVISLWAQIEQIPLLRFFIFTAMTGAFAGLGFYSEHRWKLPNTSRGLLITATMLVPLNFLAIAAFARDVATNTPMVLASEFISLALFVLIVYRAGKVITPGWEHWLTLGAVGTSAMQLLMRRVAGPETATITLCLLAALPVACFAVATWGMLRKLRAEETLASKTAHQSFTLLSASSFAALVALGLLMFKTQAFIATLERIAPIVSLLAIPALFAGIVLWQRVRNLEPNYLAIVSTSIAVLSSLLMLASLVFAWPNAINVMIVAVINFAALTFVAFAFRLPVAHLAALPCLALAYSLGVQMALGHAEYDSRLLATALLSVSSGKALALFFVIVLGAVEVLYRRARRDDGFYYAIVAAAVGALSFLLVSFHGFGRAGDPQQIAWVYALFAASAFAVAWRMQRAQAWYIGWGLAFFALTQFVHFGLGHSFKLTTLLYATSALIVAIVWHKTRPQFAGPSQLVALLAAGVAGAVLLLTLPANTASNLAAQTFWLAGLVVSLSWLYRSAALFTAFQALTYASVFCAVTATTHGTNPLSELPVGLHSLRPQMLALALLSSLWIALRLALRPGGITRGEVAAQGLPTAWQNTVARLLYPVWPSCDQVVIWGLVAGFVVLSLLGILPGIILEIAPTTNVTLRNIQHAMTNEWWLLGALVLALMMSLWEQLTTWRVLGLLLLFALSGALLAQSSVATASTLRWSAAVYLSLTSCVLWGRERLSAVVTALHFPPLQLTKPPLVHAVRAFTLCLAALPILGLTVLALLLRSGEGGWTVPGESVFAPMGAVAAYLIPLFVLSLVLIGHALRERVSGYALAGGLVLNLAVTVWYLNRQWAQELAVEASVLIALNVIVLALSGLALFVFERRLEPAGTHYYRIVALLSLTGVTLLAGQGLLFDLEYNPLPFHALLRWSAVLTTLALLLASLWDATAKLTLGGWYVMGLVIAGTAIDQANLLGTWLIFALTLSASGYVLLTSWLWAARARISAGAGKYGIPLGTMAEDGFIAANMGLIVLVVMAGARLTDAGEPFVIRFCYALAVLLQVVSLALLARGSARARALQIAALSVGLMGIVLLSWSFLPARIAQLAVHRAVIVLLVAWAAAEISGLWFIQRFTNEWGRAAKSLLYPLCGLVALVLGGLLLHEMGQQFLNDIVVVPTFAILVIAALLLVLSMQAIYFAVRAERDPLQLSERGRMGYVYASEALLALSFLHVRLTMPWLFTGFFTRYWPFVVMALAFFGVGLGELFRRRGQRVLGEPLLNTGFFLPLFPVVGFWLMASRVDYSGLLLIVGVLYAIVAALRSSFGVSLVACLAANGALWYFLSKQEHFSLLERPQLWLTPVALSVLVAAYLNRAHLSAQQMTNLRYVTLSVIYVSSTAEIFVRGVAQSPWQPLVLMVLSAAGVLAGMLLRVRAFLYLGASFLLISVFSMIWHAAANFGWTWLWYVTGIIVGLAIILLFALFEKKRNELLQLVEGLRAWEA
ncbi:MAG TPA: hypothetical protein VFZ34_21365 [Blastocatellia bacterium]|nr:hypothetical protein [Blastocatellia bacterium]